MANKANVALQGKSLDLYKVAKKWKYGSRHSHDEISNLLGIEKQTTSYYQVVNKARRELIKNGIVMTNLRNVGYRVLFPDELPAESIAILHRGTVKMKLSQDILTFAPVDKMDDLSQRQRSVALVKISNANRYMDTKKAELNNMFNRLVLSARTGTEKG
jgi:hypothetical protein